MSILRKRGKEKLRFRIMNRRVTNKEFKYFKRLFLECLRENSDIVKQLDSYYKRIQVGFFHEKTDPYAHKSLKEFFKDPNFPRSVISSSPAFAVSKNGCAYIGLYLEDLRHHFEERIFEQNVADYHKNVVFEELCHLVEQRGSYGAHPYPQSWITLLNLYDGINRKELGEEILLRLYRDRGEHEVRLLMIKAYPREWVERFWKYFRESPKAYRQQYEQWKQKNIPIDIVYARLVTDILRTIGVLDIAEKVSTKKLSKNQKKRLDALIRIGKADLENKRNLMERDMGSGALNLIDALDESIFQTSDVFFSIVLDLWKSLHLI